jgi:hypothetical protein
MPLPVAIAIAPAPGICRMVVFHDHGHPIPSDLPAVIQAVAADGSLSLFVMGLRGAVPRTGIKQGIEVGQWSWPACT